MGRLLRQPHTPRDDDCRAGARGDAPDFIVMFRLSMLDLVEGGSDWSEVVALAQAIENAGAPSEWLQP